MTRSSRSSAAACAALLIAAGRASAEPRPGFAEHLMAEGDYFRAITVFKELAFSSEPAQRAAYDYQIARAYRLSRHYELALDALEPRDDAPALGPELSAKLELERALDYIALRSPALAIPRLTEAERLGQAGLARLYQGVVELDTGAYAVAATRFREATVLAPTTGARSLARDLWWRTSHVDDLPHRSPALAASLSAVVPGAGQAYVGHWVDAAQALGFVGLFAFTSVVAYRDDHARGGPYAFTGAAVSITALFHLANIFGAHRTATYFNARQSEIAFDEARRQALGLPFLATVYRGSPPLLRRWERLLVACCAKALRQGEGASGKPLCFSHSFSRAIRIARPRDRVAHGPMNRVSQTKELACSAPAARD